MWAASLRRYGKAKTRAVGRLRGWPADQRLIRRNFDTWRRCFQEPLQGVQIDVVVEALDPTEQAAGQRAMPDRGLEAERLSLEVQAAARADLKTEARSES